MIKVNMFNRFKFKGKWRYILNYIIDKEYQVNVELADKLSKEEFISYVKNKINYGN